MAAAIAASMRLVRCRYTQRGLRMAWALTLSAALLFAQFLGLAHGIAHAGWPASASQPLAAFEAALFNYADDAATEDKQGAQHKHHHHHSCVEYDAASGATGVHVDFFAPPLIPGTGVLALWQAFASWDAPFVCHFSSRAPPR